MRHAALLAGFMGAGALAPLVAGIGASASRAPGHPAAALTAPQASQKLVSYRGVRIPVPAGWEVHRLDQDPARCVRYDRNAIYLGRPGPQPDCPAKLVGRTEALHVEPLGEPSAQRRGAVRADKLARHALTPTADHQVRLPLPEAGVTITGAYGAEPSALQNTIRATRLTTAWPAEPHGTALRRGRPVVPQVPAKVHVRQKGWAQGKGFDTCTAPSLGAMAAWRRAYGISNIYIGGAARGCAQPNLTSYWVRSVRRMGYRLIPTYVGLQAPCSRYKQHFTAKNAYAKGAAAAKDAVGRARALGIPKRKPIYFDIEAYNSRDAACRGAVLRFLHSWSKHLKARKYIPGVYSSVSSGIRDLGWATGIVKPKAIWYAHWDGKARVYDNARLPAHWWPPHRRIKQYRGGHKEEHGGVTINVDSNLVDGRVY